LSPRPISQVTKVIIEQNPEIHEISKVLKNSIKKDIDLISRHIKVTQNIYELRLKTIQKTESWILSTSKISEQSNKSKTFRLHINDATHHFS